MRRTRQRCSIRCLPMRLIPMGFSLPASRRAAAAKAATAAAEGAAVTRTAAASGKRAAVTAAGPAAPPATAPHRLRRGNAVAEHYEDRCDRARKDRREQGAE